MLKALSRRLALEPQLLAQVRARLRAARDSAPLFDSAMFTRDLERLYTQLAAA